VKNLGIPWAINKEGIAEPGGSIDAEDVCSAEAARFLATQVTFIVELNRCRGKDILAPTFCFHSPF